MGNASSLVPLTKATLSGRDSVGHLISSAGQEWHYVNYEMNDTYSNEERSLGRDKNDDLYVVSMNNNRQDFVQTAGTSS